MAGDKRECDERGYYEAMTHDDLVTHALFFHERLQEEKAEVERLRSLPDVEEVVAAFRKAHGYEEPNAIRRSQEYGIRFVFDAIERGKAER